MTTKFDADITELLLEAHYAYEKYRIQVVDAFPNGRVNPEEFTAEHHRIYRELIEAEHAVGMCRRREPRVSSD